MASLEHELQRLSDNAALRREDLLQVALAKSRRRKNLTIFAGVLALSSAAAIVTYLTREIGPSGVQALAAAVAFLSGTISLIVTAHYGEDEIFGRLAGASKYLSLRDSISRLAMDADLPERARFKQFTALQHEYANLDASYSRYFTSSTTGAAGTGPMLPPHRAEGKPVQSRLGPACLDSQPREITKEWPEFPNPADER